ncbi:fatty acid desaturase CarF family protein [Qaidamihabitans albus]|uniref:fatty acid desaturase CarF family protein n=1 Tax=Qaidamihabitans albus TaxID=2795733 RepID=UPI0018F27422|nr:fatty acid desaturase CarF family protein [Qaidamihabitans albus]
MAPRGEEVGPVVLPKSAAAHLLTPQAALFDAGAFRTSELLVHVTGAVANITVCAAAIVVTTVNVPVSGVTVPVVLVFVVGGWFVADLVSGVLHWALDTWFNENVRAVRRIVLIVREHHVYPQQIFKYRWTHEFGILSWFGLAVVSATWLLATLTTAPAPVAVGMVVGGVVASLGASFSLELHKLGHNFAPGWAVRALQRLGLVLTPAHHMKHHRAEHDTHYCIVNGWADRTLGRLGLFRALERLVAAWTGNSPRIDDRGWRRAFGRPVQDRTDRERQQQ